MHTSRLTRRRKCSRKTHTHAPLTRAAYTIWRDGRKTAAYVVHAVAIGRRRDRFEPTPAARSIALAVSSASDYGAFGNWRLPRRDASSLVDRHAAPANLKRASHTYATTHARLFLSTFYYTHALAFRRKISTRTIESP